MDKGLALKRARADLDTEIKALGADDPPHKEELLAKMKQALGAIQTAIALQEKLPGGGRHRAAGAKEADNLEKLLRQISDDCERFLAGND